MKVIETINAPGAIGPYSQGYSVNGFVYTSGQIPVDPQTGEIPEGIAPQAHQSCKNVGAILEAAGVDFTKVFKTTCFWPIWRISQNLIRYMPSISYPNLPEAVSR